MLFPHENLLTMLNSKAIKIISQSNMNKKYKLSIVLYKTLKNIVLLKKIFSSHIRIKHRPRQLTKFSYKYIVLLISFISLYMHKMKTKNEIRLFNVKPVLIFHFTNRKMKFLDVGAREPEKGPLSGQALVLNWRGK